MKKFNQEFNKGDILYTRSSTGMYLYKVVRHTKTLIYVSSYDYRTKEINKDYKAKYRRDGTNFDRAWFSARDNDLKLFTKEIEVEYLNKEYQNGIIKLLKTKKFSNDILKNILETLNGEETNEKSN